VWRKGHASSRSQRHLALTIQTSRRRIPRENGGFRLILRWWRRTCRCALKLASKMGLGQQKPAAGNKKAPRPERNKKPAAQIADGRSACQEAVARYPFCRVSARRFRSHPRAQDVGARRLSDAREIRTPHRAERSIGRKNRRGRVSEIIKCESGWRSGPGTICASLSPRVIQHGLLPSLRHRSAFDTPNGSRSPEPCSQRRVFGILGIIGSSAAAEFVTLPASGRPQSSSSAKNH